MRIYILGFMGSGKSTVGKLLAKRLDYTFIDLDEQIESKYKATVSEIFEKYGEERFRIREQKTLLSLPKKENLVVALGGGTPCFHNNIEFIKFSGKSVYLRTPSKILNKRLFKERAARPIIAKLSKKELEKKIDSMMRKRSKFYNQANITIVANDTPEMLVDRMIEKLEIH